MTFHRARDSQAKMLVLVQAEEAGLVTAVSHQMCGKDSLPHEARVKTPLQCIGTCHFLRFLLKLGPRWLGCARLARFPRLAHRPPARFKLAHMHSMRRMDSSNTVAKKLLEPDIPIVLRVQYSRIIACFP